MKRLASASVARAVLPPPGGGQGRISAAIVLTPSSRSATDRIYNIFACLKKILFSGSFLILLDVLDYEMGFDFWTKFTGLTVMNL